MDTTKFAIVLMRFSAFAISSSNGKHLGNVFSIFNAEYFEPAYRKLVKWTSVYLQPDFLRL